MNRFVKIFRRRELKKNQVAVDKAEYDRLVHENKEYRVLSAVSEVFAGELAKKRDRLGSKLSEAPDEIAKQQGIGAVWGLNCAGKLYTDIFADALRVAAEAGDIDVDELNESFAREGRTPVIATAQLERMWGDE